MKKTFILLCTCLVLVVCVSGQSLTKKRAAAAPPSKAEMLAANKAWPAFWRAFLAAIKSSDRAALKKMMPDDFFDGGGGLTPAEWLEYIQENKTKGSWRDLNRSFSKGTVISAEWIREGVPTRVTRDKAYYFEFREDQRWYFAGIVSH